MRSRIAPAVVADVIRLSAQGMMPAPIAERLGLDRKQVANLRQRYAKQIKEGQPMENKHKPLVDEYTAAVEKRRAEKAAEILDSVNDSGKAKIEVSEAAATITAKTIKAAAPALLKWHRSEWSSGLAVYNHVGERVGICVEGREIAISADKLGVLIAELMELRELVGR